ncbi:MAG: PAS domain S-box protein [Candidatus Hydrogenedentales bacterium]|jgi:PAS domain S-box-containing protein
MGLASTSISDQPLNKVALRLVVAMSLLWLMRALVDVLNVFGYLPYSMVVNITTVCDLCLCVIVVYYVCVCLPLLRARYLLVLMLLGCALVLARSILRSFPSAGQFAGLEPFQLTQLADGVIANGGALVLAGSFCFILVYLRNSVVRLVREERQLQESEERFRLTFEHAPDGYFLSNLDGVFLNGNHASEKLIGYRREELIGKSYLELELVDPESLSRALTAMAENRKGNDAGPNEFNLVRKDGSLVAVEVCAHPVPLHGETVVLGIARDISERKRTEAALHESEERYRGLVEQTHDIIVRVDLTGRITFINAASEAMLGYSPSELVGQYYRALVPEETARQVDANLVRRFEGGIGEGSFVQEIALRRRDGSVFFGELRSAPFRGGDNIAREIQGVIRDVTERKRSEEERREMDRRMQHVQKLESLGVLAGGIAHDFNNLLLLVLGNADLALNELPPMSPARESLAEIEKAACQAADLCRQMLAYAGKGKFVLESIRVNELIEEMAHLLNASIGKKAILNLDLGKDLPPLEGDPSQIRQIVMNLITNASEAIGDESGVITVSTGAMECTQEYLQEMSFEGIPEEGTYVYIDVSDTGCGMDQETMQRIFEPFFTTKFTGRGLGMAAVLGIVRGHKGAIRIYSEPGRGTTFKVLFPALLLSPTAAVASTQSESNDWRGHGRILLVDDEPQIRALGKRMLEKLGFEVITAGDGREAVESFRERKEFLDLVLLDLTMPIMGGEEAFHELRSIAPGIRIVISSGYTEHEVAGRFAGEEIDGFVQKPYVLTVLRDCIRAALEAETKS